MAKFEPNVVAIACDWCSLQAGDFVGITRLFFPKKVSFVRVPCSGTVSPELLSEAFLKLSDGVLVMGCATGSCNYLTGNFQAERVAKAFREALSQIGVEPNRLELHLESDTEITVVYEAFVERIRKLGPLAPKDQLKRRQLKELLESCRDALLNPDIRWLVAREWTLVTRENVFGETVDPAEYDRTLRERITEELLMARIKQQVAADPLSAREIAERLGRSPRDVFGALVELRKRAAVTMVEAAGRDPRYLAA
jgi:coenzyme F420-reducing hydrogenase delta subunit